MHTYCVFHFTHLHVSVPLDHLQSAFCYRIHYCLNAHVQYKSIYSVRAEYVLCVKNVSVCVRFGVQVEIC